MILRTALVLVLLTYIALLSMGATMIMGIFTKETLYPLVQW